MDRGHSCTKQQSPLQPSFLSAAKYRTSCPGRILQRSCKRHFPPSTPWPVFSLSFNNLQARDSLGLNKQIYEGSAVWTRSALHCSHWESTGAAAQDTGGCTGIHTDTHSSKDHMFCISSMGCHYTNQELTRIRWSLSNRSCNDPGYLSSFQSLSLNLLFPFLEECFLLPLHLSNLQRLKFFFSKDTLKPQILSPLRFSYQCFIAKLLPQCNRSISGIEYFTIAETHCLPESEQGLTFHTRVLQKACSTELILSSRNEVLFSLQMPCSHYLTSIRHFSLLLSQITQCDPRNLKYLKLEAKKSFSPLTSIIKININKEKHVSKIA